MMEQIMYTDSDAWKSTAGYILHHTFESLSLITSPQFHSSTHPTPAPPPARMFAFNSDSGSNSSSPVGSPGRVVKAGTSKKLPVSMRVEREPHTASIGLTKKDAQQHPSTPWLMDNQESSADDLSWG